MLSESSKMSDDLPLRYGPPRLVLYELLLFSILIPTILVNMLLVVGLILINIENLYFN